MRVPAPWTVLLLIPLSLAGRPASARAQKPAGAPAVPAPATGAASTTPPASTDTPSMTVGDRAFAERAHQVDGAWQADAAAVGRAVEAYQAAVTADPDDLSAWRGLLTALYFEGEYLATDVARRREVFDRGKNAAEAALARLAQRVGVEPADFRDLDPEQRVARLLAHSDGGTGEGELLREQAAALYFWSGVHWGLWGDAFGRLAAARQGVAGTVRDDALTALALDPHVERAGPHRVLGRLHAEAPKIPFFTGWIDRDVAVSELETAVAEAPDEPLNRLYLAEALLDYRPERAADALAQLRAILSQPVTAPRAVEMTSAQAQARLLLGDVEDASR